MRGGALPARKPHRHRSHGRPSLKANPTTDRGEIMDWQCLVDSIEEWIDENESEETTPVKEGDMTEEEDMRTIPFEDIDILAADDLPEGDLVEFIKNLSKFLRNLPPEVKNLIKKIILTNQPGGESPPELKGSAGGDGQWVLTDPADARDEDFYHLTGHTVGNKVWAGGVPPVGSLYDQAIDSDEPPPFETYSEGKAEDFAASFAMYLEHRAALQISYPRRYDAILNLLQDPDSPIYRAPKFPVQRDSGVWRDIFNPSP